MFERFREASASPRFRRLTAWPSRATVASRSSFASVLSQPLTCLPIPLGSKPAHDQHGEIISRLGAVGKNARSEVEHTGKSGDEEHFRVVARGFVVGRTHEAADAPAEVAQRITLVESLADRHENAGREAFAGDISDDEKQSIRVEKE